MVSATVSPVTAAMSMPREPTTRSRTWSPSAQRSRRASSAEGGTKLLRLLVGIRLVGHGAASHFGTGQVLAQARSPEGRVQLKVERVVRMVADRGLMHRQDVGQAKAPERVVAPHHVAQHETERPAFVVV